MERRRRECTKKIYANEFKRQALEEVEAGVPINELEGRYEIGKDMVKGLQTDEMEHEFRSIWNNIDSVEGHLAHGQEACLYKLAKSQQPDAVILEIGCYKGRSTTCLAYGCKNSNKHVYCIDTFDGNDAAYGGPRRRGFFQEWKENIRKNGLSDYVTAIVNDSKKACETWDLPIDFLFIDGSHEYEDALADFDNFYPHVVNGGIIAMHDVGQPAGPTRVWQERKHLLENTSACWTLAYGIKHTS